MKSRFVTIPIWERKLLLVTGCNKEQLLELIKKHKFGRIIRNQVIAEPPFSSGKGYGCMYMDDIHMRYIIYFPNNRVRTDTIIHETNHLVKHLMKNIGAQQEIEAHAYTQEWLYNWIRKNL